MIFLLDWVSLSEASRRISNLKESWKRLIKSGQAETMPIMESSSRRRTGLVNSLPISKKEPRKYSRKQLVKPFLDTGNWFQGNEENLCEDESNAASCVETTNDNITNMLKVPTDNQNASIFDRFCHQISFIIHKEKVITYPDVSEKVLVADRVKSAIKTSVMEDLKGHDNSSDIIAAQVTHKQRAVHVLHQMRSCISSFLLKIAAWVMYKLLGKMLDGIEVRRDQVETLKRVSEEKIPIIYLPLHRSHLDYILVTFILFMNDMRAPLVAAGNNLMIPFFGSLLRGLGAFFIKRKLDPQNGQRDFVYRAILHTYMEESLKAGHSLEFFIEGGRSRTGKAVLPKAGLLSIVVDTLMSVGGIKDAYVVPIAMSYEKLLDGNFISEQLGRPKQMESFTTAIKGIWRILHSNFGTVRVDFCKPFSLKEFLCAAEFSYNSPATALQPSLGHQNQHFFNHNMKSRRRSEYGTEIVSEDHRQLIKDLADYIVYDASNAYSLMSTNLLAFLLLTKHRKGTTFDHLVNSMSWLREEISKRNKTLNWHGDSDELVVRASRLLGSNLVHVETVQMEWSLDQTNNNNNMKLYYYKPSVNLPEVLELQYYANSVLPVFLIESIIINAVYSFVSDDTINRNEENNTYVQRSNILKQSLELCSIMQYEFIFSPPGTSVCSVLNAAIDDLLENSLLQLKDKSVIGNTTDALPDLIVDDFFIHGDRHELKQEITFSTDHENLSNVHFLRCILSPFIESYFIVASSLPKLVDSELEETSLLQEIKSLGSKQIHIGQICHDECLGLDTLRNALKLFESWKVIDVRSHGSQKLYSLHRYYNDTHRIDDIIVRIRKFMH
nr:glycerol-3-phosphate acyltransferase 1, mitochondrial isoform X3 [Parasteatoda tepidariorum]